MIVVDSSVWIDFFNGASTPEVERLDGLLGVVQGFRHEKDVATARQLFRSLAPLTMLGARNAWKAAENYRELRRRIDAQELARYGKGKRVDSCPRELQRRQDRLDALRKAKAELEAEAASDNACLRREQQARAGRKSGVNCQER